MMKGVELFFDPSFFDLLEDFEWNMAALEVDEDPEILAEDPDYDEGFSEPVWVEDLSEDDLNEAAVNALFPDAVLNEMQPFQYDLPVNENIDLTCYEEMPSESFLHDCDSCRFVRENTCNPNALCLFCAASVDPMEGPSGENSTRKRHNSSTTGKCCKKPKIETENDDDDDDDDDEPLNLCTRF
ncbi:E1A [bottlenose dolphin adenovirus 2]|uniref:E1A n=1 Tax=bottlenose dolphin adenovirus 2 TaxID=2849592 RepID=A0A0M4M219_9ADEN|nr:E1A [Bottlenose dolphin adenovirus 1]ALE15290.1 E1A [Bottlenose dolphin adenovirus 1]